MDWKTLSMICSTRQRLKLNVFPRPSKIVSGANRPPLLRWPSFGNAPNGRASLGRWTLCA